MKILLENITKAISQEFEHFKKSYRQEFISVEPLIGDITEYLLTGEGKLLRPIIVLLSAKMNGKICDKTYVIAKSVEMLHTATLIHDDIVDNASVRRGMPTVQSQWTPQIAVLAGDYLLAKSLDLITKNKLYDALSIATEIVRFLSEGELFQIQKSFSLDTSEDEYLKIIYKKTASLICGCAQLGAMTADADEKSLVKMIEIGKNVGLAFQIRDDIFDFEKENISGKSYGNDLREHKLTLPLIYALQKSSENERREILKKLNSCEENPQFIDTIIDFTIAAGGIDFAEKQMQKFSESSIKLLSEFPESEARESLILLAKYTATRKK
jgi:octaprenyl-diphosphate synthase